MSERQYTTFTVRSSIASMHPGAIVVQNGNRITALDGVTPDMLRGLAFAFASAADLMERGEDRNSSHGPSSLSIGYEIEWTENIGAWPESRIDEATM